MIVRLASALLLAWLIGFAWFAIDLPKAADSARVTDAIVVVTGGAGRVPRGMALLAAHRARRMLISGVDRQVRKPDLAEANDVSGHLMACCVDLGHEAVDTRSNADETAAWLKRHDYRSVRLVTTDWHMRRARFELARVLPPGVTLVTDAVPSEPGLAVLVGEYHKYLLRRLSAPLGL